MTPDIKTLSEMEESRKQEAISNASDPKKAAVTEYNRRRSEIALSLFPVALKLAYTVDGMFTPPPQEAFEWAESFLKEEARWNNGENQ